MPCYLIHHFNEDGSHIEDYFWLAGDGNHWLCGENSGVIQTAKMVGAIIGSHFSGIGCSLKPFPADMVVPFIAKGCEKRRKSEPGAKNSIPMIKLYRAFTDSDLKTAKNFVEGVMRAVAIYQDYNIITDDLRANFLETYEELTDSTRLKEEDARKAIKLMTEFQRGLWDADLERTIDDLSQHLLNRAANDGDRIKADAFVGAVDFLTNKTNYLQLGVE